MLKLSRNPTFKHRVEIPRPGEKSVPIKVEFMAKTRKELEFWLESCKGKPPSEIVPEIVVGWEDVEAAFSRENLELLMDTYPASALEIFTVYCDSHAKARLGN